MSAEPAHPLPPPGGSEPRPEPPLTTAPLLVWLVLQLGATLLAALRIPLAAVYPEPPERLAPHWVLGVQVVAASMLFPFLLRDWRSAVTVLATAVPFQLAAGYLAGMNGREILPAGGLVLAWITTLGVWRTALPSRSALLLGASLATSLTLGGGILCYLRLEFGLHPGGGGKWETASPLLTTFAALAGEPTAAGWLALSAIAAGGLGASAFRRRSDARRRRRAAIPA